MPEVKEVIEHLKSYKPNEHIAYTIWREEDVLGRAKELKVKISKAEARDILDTIHSKQDCELGISWTTLDVYIQDFHHAK
jgi:hypothetical protein